MSTLIHITPQLPPAIDGVGDYCWNLWKHWPVADADWQFLVARGAEDTRGAWPEAKVREFNLNAASLANALEQSGAETVVLHYVGYAYQPKGIPVWLPGALRQLHCGGNGNDASSKQNRRLVVMFHEMYARSSPLRSPFWVAPFARKIIRELVTLSDAWVTSCERYFRQLTTEFNAQPSEGRIIPIPSNVPARVMTASNKRFDGPLRIAVFGLARTRLWALERHWRLLGAMQQAGRLEHVTLVGKRPGPEDERSWQEWANRIGSDVRWRKRFDLSTTEISQELEQHDLGLLANEPDILTKSGVFAALATHGVIPIVSTPSNEALPANLSNGILANDDSAALPQIVQSLHNAEQLQSRREQLLAFATRELAWPGIAQSWASVFKDSNCLKAAESSLPLTSQFSRGIVSTEQRRLQTGSTLEVRA